MTRGLSPRRFVVGLTFACALAVPVSARAGTTRLAVLVGNDTGDADQQPLRYAERDAAKMALVLGDLGRVAPADLFLLQGRSRGTLDAVFGKLKHRITEIHAQPGELALLVFYFSGHSDGESLELSGDRLPYADLRKQLKASGADTRVVIVDSCRSGSLLAAKGGAKAPAFDISLSDDLPASGQVLLTSSAANEEALESVEIQGSFFTHHLVSGLRGAADVSGDGRVTLAEAYRYAYAHMVAATANELAATQHPGYDFQITGTGELVLTDLGRSRASLQLPSGYERAIIAETRHNEVLAEVAPGSAGRVVVSPGDYLVRLWRGGRTFAGHARALAGGPTLVQWAALAQEAPTGESHAKGGGAVPSLREAIDAYQRLDDATASQAFQSILATNPPRETAAKAHLYLGLIAFNALHLNAANEEFKKAIRANPTLDVPLDTSPKPTLAYGQAREEVAHEISHPELSPAPAEAISPTVAEVQATATPSRSHVLSYVLGGTALALGVVAAVGGVQVLNYNSFVDSVNSGQSMSTGPQAASAQSSANFWRVAWIAFAAGGAAAATGGVLAW